MSRWYSDIQAILRGEPETWIAYLYGQQLDNIPHLTRSKPRVRGAVFRCLLFLLFLLRHLKLRQPESVKLPAQYLVFASTINQMRALEGMVGYLKANGCRVVKIGHIKHADHSYPSRAGVPFSFTIADILKTLLLAIRNAASLRGQLKKANPVAAAWYLDVFCGVYAYLVYFYRVLVQTRPRLVIVSNDHNPSNRALLAVAHQLGIETAYLQHASVSRSFPALRVNHAFLDGQCAKEIYQQCEPNQPATDRPAPEPNIYLTGQKKRLKMSTDESGRVGVALNALDNTDIAVSIVKALTDAGRIVIVRWHPGQAARQVEALYRAFSKLEQVEWSDPKREPVGDFLAGISYLIAGNSSIHLEAALAGVTPIYYEFSPSDKRDYYGYVKNGLAMTAASLDELLAYTSKTRGQGEADVESVRYYSATYMTEWQGKEAELVGRKLLLLGQINQKNPN